jgi:hypothetical protein
LHTLVEIDRLVKGAGFPEQALMTR